ncbi:hypothetical protein G9A89_005713 [Geosiphon pyriformis]|nr:hypothetical protein G9A89_005713 [Geosiphon pyriformis]
MASKEEKKEDQKFNYQNLITKNPEVETPNIQIQQIPNNPNSELINQQNLPPEIVINQQPINLIAKQLQQLPILPQQLLFQSPQQPNLNPMAYTPIAKLEKFTGKEDNAQMWLNNVEKAIAANRWNDTRAINILSATITNNESLAAIFSFELKELLSILLFNKTMLEEKPITTMYTDVKVNGDLIKLILDSRLTGIDCIVSTRIITADGVTKTLIGEIDNFSIEVNSIIVPIKILVMEATQY